jgi:hypothetical protein
MLHNEILPVAEQMLLYMGDYILTRVKSGIDVFVFKF